MSKAKLAIIDYGAGNLASVGRALDWLQIPWQITANPEEVLKAGGIIFPGVGNAAQAMASLESTGLAQALAKAVSVGIPIFGICLGCQILLEESAEGNISTLGLIPGRCERFADNMHEEDGSKAPVPHIGWNSIAVRQECPLLEGLPPNAEFYFVHSYYAMPRPDFVIATSYYGHEFCSVYGRKGLWAAQFHPEKSGAMGLRILKNFSDWCDSHAV